jgi:hypothetical protein
VFISPRAREEDTRIWELVEVVGFACPIAANATTVTLEFYRVKSRQYKDGQQTECTRAGRHWDEDRESHGISNKSLERSRALTTLPLAQKTQATKW